MDLILMHTNERAPMANPWDEWVPGVLNSRQMEQLLEEEFITYEGPVAPEVGHSSMDLNLSDEAYEMLGGSVKPSQRSYSWFIKKKGLAKPIPKPKDGIFHLKRKTTYVFRLQEKLDPSLFDGGIYGQATAKSSVGRVDVLARLIVDGMNAYESFDPRAMKGANGNLYLEITPITFNVTVKVNTSLSQLRLFYGSPDDVEIRGNELFHTVFRGSEHQDGSLNVSLAEGTIGDPNGTACKGVAFRSKKDISEHAFIPLWSQENQDDLPDPIEYWDVEVTDKHKRLLIQQDLFYILRSKEKLHVPKGIAIYCRASDETMGEMRIHYAGFVHPYFGLYREDNTQGTPLIFEVRGHQVPVSLADGEKMASLVFYRMSEDAPKLTPEQEKKEAKGYGSQDLKLSTRFREWPKHIKRNDDGTVQEIAGEENGNVETSK